MAKKTKDIQYFEAIGRRKEAIARVRLYITGKDKTATVNNHKHTQGDIIVNNQPATKFFGRKVDEQRYNLPFELTNTKGRFVTTIVIKGGGKEGQIEAVMHGIAHALDKVDKETYRPLLKEQGLLTRDPRTRERRMVGTGGKSRRKKQSPKR